MTLCLRMCVSYIMVYTCVLRVLRVYLYCSVLHLKIIVYAVAIHHIPYEALRALPSLSMGIAFPIQVLLGTVATVTATPSYSYDLENDICWAYRRMDCNAYTQAYSNECYLHRGRI